MKTLRLFLAVFAVLFVALFCAVDVARAQDAPVPDLANVALPGGIPVVAVLAVVGTLVVGGVKMLAPRIPSQVLPFIAPVVTILLDWLAGLAFGTASNPWLALGAGVASIGLFELKKQALAKPLALPVTE